MQILNLTRNTPIVTNGRVAGDFLSRFVGLMGRTGLAAGEGLVITRSNSIHTHFMRFPIDVLYVSRDNEVVYIDHAMPPWRFGRIHRRGHLVIELPAGTAMATGTQTGDRLELTIQAQSPGGP